MVSGDSLEDNYAGESASLSTQEHARSGLTSGQRSRLRPFSSSSFR